MPTARLHWKPCTDVTFIGFVQRGGITGHTRETEQVSVVVTAPLNTDKAWEAFERKRL